MPKVADETRKPTDIIIVQSVGVYAPEGTKAELAKDCKMNAEGTKFIEPCQFKVKVEVLKYVAKKK
jgi:hypothetical protein